MPTTQTSDPFAAIRDRLPTRYAPGAAGEDGQPGRPYDFPDDPTVWVPLIYYPAGEVVKGEGPIWLVEPYPAERADGTDGQDPVTSADVTVVRHHARPRPRGADPDGDWIVPEHTLNRDTGYDAYVTNQPDLLAAWCEAYAIAIALNNGLVDALGLKPEDVDVLLAAERGDLTGDSRFTGTINEMRWRRIGGKGADEEVRVGARQARRLRGSLAAIEAGDTREGGVPGRPDLSTAGLPWTETTYRLTRAGATMLAEIRRSHDGVARCRVCGCTQDRACPDGCCWIDADLCSSCPADDPETATR